MRGLTLRISSAGQRIRGRRSRFDSYLSHHSRFSCECNEGDTTDDRRAKEEEVALPAPTVVASAERAQESEVPLPSSFFFTELKIFMLVDICTHL